MTKSLLSSVSWSGDWEARDSRNICRWMIAWTSAQSNCMGAIAGYSGGGAFQLEKFFLSSNDECYIEATDDLSFLNNEEINHCEDCVDLILSFHSDEDWIDSENLHLLDEKINQLKSEDDGYSGGARIPNMLLQMWSSIGLISRPLSGRIEII